MIRRRVTGEFPKEHGPAETKSRRGRRDWIEVTAGMPGVRIGVNLQEIQSQLRIVPGPQIMQPRTSNRRQRRAVCVHESAHVRHHPAKELELERTRHARAEIAFPFLDNEVWF